MTVEERRRIELYQQLTTVIGKEAADTMLELLPPPGRDAATTDDLRREMVQLRNEMATMRAELIAVFREEINRAVVTQTRITVFSMVTAFAAVAALALGLS